MTSVPAATAGDVPGQSVGRFWWIPLVAGVLSLIFGFVALLYPGPTLLVLGVLFGAYLTIWGVMHVVSGVTDDAAPTFARVLLVILGLLGALAGLILLVRPGQSLVTAALVLGFWWALLGIMQLARGLMESDGRVWNILMGILGVVAGAIILAQPGIGLVTLVVIVSITLIFQGCLEIAGGLTVRRLHKEGVV